MTNSFGKYEKHVFHGLNSLKGGADLAAKSVTTTTKTIERGNDLDSARDIESDVSGSSQVLAPAP
jgi:hypothetical protein